MKRLEKIIVPTDLTEYSRTALRYAGSLAADANSALVIVHVANEFSAWELHDDVFGLTERWPLERVLEEAALDLNRFLEVHTDLLRGVTCLTKRVVLGSIPHQIVTVAEEEKADLVVMAPQRRRGFRPRLRGRITEKVTRMSPCPVLSVMPPLPSKQWRGKLLPLGLGWSRPDVQSV